MADITLAPALMVLVTRTARPPADQAQLATSASDPNAAWHRSGRIVAARAVDDGGVAERGIDTSS